MRGAPATIALVIPVRTDTNAGIGSPGRTRVWNSPSTTPPRTFTAPISVMLLPAGLPPVVSRSSTTKVTSANGVPRSSSVPWTATGLTCMGPTLGATTDKVVSRLARRRLRRRLSVVAPSVGDVIEMDEFDKTNAPKT